MHVRPFVLQRNVSAGANDCQADKGVLVSEEVLFTADLRHPCTLHAASALTASSGSFTRRFPPV